MMRSMFSGVSGLRVHQTKMDVIANNISNVNTVGYKSSRVTFNEVFSQTLSSASSANPAVSRGGTNAMQIGLGANVSSIDMLMTPGASQRTDNPYDLMIQGEGFFIVTDESGTYFTRAGAFRLDNFGNIVNPQGMQLNGWRAQPVSGQPGEYEIQKTGVQPITIGPEDEYINAEVTTLINFEGNLNALKDPTKTSTMSFFDSLGNKYVLDVKYIFNSGTGDWDMLVGNYMYPEGDKSKGGVYIGSGMTVYDPLDPQGNGTALGAGDNPNSLTGSRPYGLNLSISTPAADTSFEYMMVGKIKFGTDGKLVTDNNDYMTGVELFINEGDPANPVLSPEASFGQPIVTTFYKMLQQSGNTTAQAVMADGRKPGQLSGISIGSDGVVTGRYSNGQVKPLWQIALAQFKNPAGLERAGSNLYIATPNSGEFDGVGVEAGAGTTLLAGVLEMANVDLAQEFTEMITTQRGFQANSRVITTSDEMLQELVNLKR